MKYLRAIGSAIRNAADFSGRANRREFWLWLVFAVLVWILLRQLDLRYVPEYFDTGYLPMEDGAPTYLSNGWLILCILPTVSALVRRVHDHDKPGWMALTIIPLLWWLVAKGTPGPNRYGE